MASTSRKKAVNKRTLSPIDRNSDFTSQNERFVEKIRFHYAEKAAFTGRNIKKNS